MRLKYSASIDDAHNALSAVQTLPAFLNLPDLFEKFHVQQPRIEIHLSQDDPGQLLALVARGLAMVLEHEPAIGIARLASLDLLPAGEAGCAARSGLKPGPAQARWGHDSEHGSSPLLRNVRGGR